MLLAANNAAALSDEVLAMGGPGSSTTLLPCFAAATLLCAPLGSVSDVAFSGPTAYSVFHSGTGL